MNPYLQIVVALVFITFYVLLLPRFSKRLEESRRWATTGLTPQELGLPPEFFENARRYGWDDLLAPTIIPRSRAWDLLLWTGLVIGVATIYLWMGRLVEALYIIAYLP